jgi:hypothetical protein
MPSIPPNSEARFVVAPRIASFLSSPEREVSCLEVELIGFSHLPELSANSPTLFKILLQKHFYLAVNGRFMASVLNMEQPA